MDYERFFPKLQLVSTVRIHNRRLNLIFTLARLAVLTYVVFDFISARKLKTKIPFSTELFPVSANQGFVDVQSFQISAGTLNLSLDNPWLCPGESFRAWNYKTLSYDGVLEWNETALEFEGATLQHKSGFKALRCVKVCGEVEDGFCLLFEDMVRQVGSREVFLMTSFSQCFFGALVILDTIEDKLYPEKFQLEPGGYEWSKRTRTTANELQIKWTESGVSILPRIGLGHWNVSAGELLSAQHRDILIARGLFDTGLHVGFLSNEFSIGHGKLACIENRYLAVGVASIEFTYNYALTTSLPDSSGPFNKHAVQRGSNEQATTILLDSVGKPWVTFPPNAHIILNASLLAFLAGGYRHPVMGKRSNPLRSLDLVGDPMTIPEWIYVTGVSLVTKVDCYNDGFDLAEALGDFDATAEPSLDHIVCLLSIMISKGESPRRVSKAAPRAEMRGIEQQFGLNILSSSGGGLGRFWDPGGIMIHVTAALVLLSIPSKLIRFFALNCLGKLSSIYKNAVAPNFDVRMQIAGAITRLMAHSVVFSILADEDGPDGMRHASISRRRVREQLEKVLRHRKTQLHEGGVAALSDYTYNLVVENTKYGYRNVLGIDHFSEASSANDKITFDTLVGLQDSYRRRSQLEQFFTPPSIQKIIRQGQSLPGNVKDAIEMPEDDENRNPIGKPTETGTETREDALQVNSPKLQVQRATSDGASWMREAVVAIVNDMFKDLESAFGNEMSDLRIRCDRAENACGSLRSEVLALHHQLVQMNCQRDGDTPRLTERALPEGMVAIKNKKSIDEPDTHIEDMFNIVDQHLETLRSDNRAMRTALNSAEQEIAQMRGQLVQIHFQLCGRVYELQNQLEQMNSKGNHDSKSSPPFAIERRDGHMIEGTERRLSAFQGHMSSNEMQQKSARRAAGQQEAKPSISDTANMSTKPWIKHMQAADGLA